jgi:enterochelin esterase-like enzyme
MHEHAETHAMAKRTSPTPFVLPNIIAAAALALTAAVLPAPAVAQSGQGGTVEQIKVHSPAIEDNLQGNSAERDVLVYLPPSYTTQRRRRYPVVYQLHGWLPSAEQWSGMIDFKAGTDRAIASGGAKEMIIVVPDSLTVHGGSMYSTSVTSGDFEGFIARDLVAYIDEHYRTLARRESRGNGPLLVIARSPPAR